MGTSEARPRLRVVHAITRLIIGGAQENTLASVLGLQAVSDFDVELLSGPTAGPEGYLLAEGQPASLRMTLMPRLVRPVHPWNDLLAWRDLTRWFRARSPDLVHTHSGKAGFLGRLAAARAGVPIIVHTIHGPSFGRFQGPLANALFTAAERRAGRYTTHFVTVSEAMTRQYRAAGIGTPDRFSCIYSSFDLEPFLQAANAADLRQRWGFGPGDVVVGKVARLFTLKGHEDLLAVVPELVRRCPQLKFLLVGDGAWRARFERDVRERGLAGHVRFTGLVPPAAIPGLMGIMDVVVHLSRREGLARALPQALAAGRPVVAYDYDGAGEVCVSDQTGFLVPAGDREELMNRVLQLAGDPGLRERLGREGRERVRERFSLAHMLAALERLYRRLAAAHLPSALTRNSQSSP